MFVNERFELKEYTKESLQDLESPFTNNPFGEITYYRTYSRNINGKQESWVDTVIRVIEGIFSIRKDWYIKNHISWDEHYWQNYAKKVSHSMFNMEWLPPGRGLWACGTKFIYERGSMALYNCFSGNTEFYVNGTIGKLKDYENCDIEILTSTNELKKATVKNFGKQKLQTVILSPKGGRTKLKFLYEVTKNHRWILEDGTITTSLKPKDRILVKAESIYNVNQESQEYIDGFTHGIVFGDGTQQTAHSERYSIRLCKNWELIHLLRKCTYYRTDCSPPSYNGDPHITFVNRKINYKLLPESINYNYLKGFIDGWMEADGHIIYTGKEIRYHLDSQNYKATQWIIKRAKAFGLIPVGHNQNNKPTNYGERTAPLNRITFSKNDVSFIVEALVERGKEEDVYCVVEPETKSFVLAGGIPTGNCSFTEIHEGIVDDICWAMDCLMLGVGVGFKPIRNDNIKFKNPHGSFEYVIPDSREGWCDSVGELINCYIYGSSKPKYVYDKIRLKGALIKGFGGVASGPEPLIYLHKQIEENIELYMTDKYYDSVLFETDLMNQVGCCIIAGNLRRSAELGLLSIKDPTFKDLKDYKKYPRRSEWGWLSNNSVELKDDIDFEQLDEIAKRVIENGEPGYANLQNFKYGRIGKKDKIRIDRAMGLNPCGEITLEGGYYNGQRVREVCNVNETFPTMCSTIEDWYKACEYATFYCSTVSLLPTHQPSTNRVVARNRRIGVGIVDYTGWIHEENTSMVTKYLRKGYSIVRKTNKLLNFEAGVPLAIKVTCAKPGGTVPKLAGKTSGIGYPNFEYMIRRFDVGRNAPIHKLLVAANVPYEASFVSQNTDVFEFPLHCGPAPPAEEISVWNQAMNLVLIQREWADNAISNTLNFKPKWRLIKRFSILEGCDNPFDYTRQWLLKNVEHNLYNKFMDDFALYFEELEHHPFKIKVKLNNRLKAEEINIYQYDSRHEEDSIEPLLAAIAPLTKSVSMMPHTAKGVYMQSPEEGISKQEYELRLGRIKKIDWSKFNNSDGIDEKFCTGDQCQLL